MNIVDIAQKTLDTLNKELTDKTAETKILQGAIHGVNLLYQNIMTAAVEEQENKDDGDKKSKDNKTKDKDKK